MAVVTNKRFATAVVLMGLLWLPDCGWLGNAQITSSGSSTLSGTQSPISPLPTTSGPQLSLNISSPAVVNQCWAGVVTYLNNGQVAAIPLATIISLTANSTISFFSSPACTASSSITQVSLSLGASASAFWMNFSNTGNYSISASVLSGSPAGSASLPVNVLLTSPATVPASLTIAGPSQLNAGACSAYTATLLNSSSIPVSFTSTTALTLAGGGAGAQFFTDSGCSNSTNSIAVPAGTPVTTFFYKQTSVGSGTITGTEGGLTGNLPVIAVAGPPNHLAIAGATTINNNSCVQYTVSILDTYQNATSFTTGQSAQLQTTGPGNFYSNSGCTSQTTTLSLAANTSSGSVYYQSGFGGNPQFTAALSPLTNGSLSVTVIDLGPGVAAKLAFTAPGNTTSAGTCYGPYSVTVEDTSGRSVSNQSSYTVALSQNGSGHFYSDSGCSNGITSTAATQVFFFKDTYAENLTLTASTTSLAQATEGLTVNAGATSLLELFTDSSSFAAGYCEPMEVAFTDNYGNGTPLVNGANVTFTQTGLPMGSLFLDSGCSSPLNMSGTSPTLAIAKGNYEQTFYYKATISGAATLTAASPGVNSALSQFTVTAGAPSTVKLITSPNPVVVGACNGPFVFGLFDQYGNATVASVSTVFTITVNQGSFYTSTSCSGSSTTSLTFASGTGQTNLYFNPASMTIVTGTLASSGFTTYNFTFAISPGGPADLVLSGVSPLSIAGPGQGVAGKCLPLSVSLTDAFGDSVTNSTSLSVSFSASGPGTSVFYQDSSCKTSVTSLTLPAQTNSIGVYYEGTGAGNLTLTASATGLNNATYQLALSAGPAAELAISGPSNGIAGVCAGPFQVTVADSFGNPTAGPGLSISLSGASQGLFYQDNFCSTQITSVAMTAPYVSAQFYLGDFIAENLTLAASANNVAGATYPFPVGPNSPQMLLFKGPTSVSANQCGGPLTFEVTDHFGNVTIDPVNDRVFTLGESGGINVMGPNCQGAVLTVPVLHATKDSLPFSFGSPYLQSSQLSFIQTYPYNPSIGGSITLSVVQPLIPQITAFALNAIPETSIAVSPSQSVNVSWTAVNVSSCVVDPGSVSITVTGSEGACGLKNFTASKTYNMALNCTGLNGAPGVSQLFTVSVLSH